MTIKVYYKVPSPGEDTIELPPNSGRHYRSIYIDDPTFEEEPETDCCYIEPTSYKYSISSKNVNQSIPDTNRHYNYTHSILTGEMPIFIPLGDSGKKLELSGFVYGKNIVRLFHVYPDMLVIITDDHFTNSMWEIESRELNIDKSMPLYVRRFTLNLLRQYHTEDRP